MSDGVLSQEEINALLSGGTPDTDTSGAVSDEELTAKHEEQDYSLQNVRAVR